MSHDVRVTPKAFTQRGDAVVVGDNGKPLMVFGGIPGEEAVVWVYQVGQNQSLGLWRAADEPSPDRVDPPCDKVTACGGCPIMHVGNAGQWKAREKLVYRALEDHDLTDLRITAHHDSPDGLLDYRHVVKLGVGYSDQGSLRVGAWGRRSRTIVPIPHCPVTTDSLRRAMSTLAHYIIELDIRPYEPATERGVLRSIVARQSRTTGEVLITLVVGNRIRQLGELAELVANDVTEVAGVWVHINSEEGNHIFQRDDLGGVRTKPLVGKAWIEETIGGVTYRMGPGDFFQTNPAVAEVLYERTLDRLGVKEGSLVVDLYAGVGGMALQAAKRAGWALGVELVEGAVGHARESARRNGLTAEFINDEVHMALPLVQKRLGKRRPDVVVNPARRGLEEGVIDELVALNPRRIAYVSCNPWALARDLQEFKAKGFTIGDLELFNMFPNTAHVETLVVLEGPGADEAPGRAPRRKVARR